MMIASLLVFWRLPPRLRSEDPLASLAWMAGDWMGVDGGVEMEDAGPSRAAE